MFSPLARATAVALPLLLGATHLLPAQDTRQGLRTGYADAGVAARHIELLGHAAKPAAFYNAADPGSFTYANSDIAFTGSLVVQGGWHGFQIWDIANPSAITLRTAFVCNGGQGDPSVYGTLLFISVEDPTGRLDCTATAMPEPSNPARFRGVRIFDISNLDAPKQIAAVQTCRGSHTHTLVTDPKDSKNLYVYVQGTGGVRPATELAGCSAGDPAKDPNTSLFRIEIIRVPLANPQDAQVIAAPRIFADAKTGAIAGLAKGGNTGPGTQETSTTDQCHDITVYPAIGLAAGACSGNGILLDISKPASPKRIDEVSDPNFAYWHSATFSNDGTKLLFSDEWGGGMGARCRATDRPEWGADALFTLTNKKMRAASYYKIPGVQSDAENCVAHNGSLIPVPGRDILVQAWYQGGLSVMDFTDIATPTEIAFFDRGPMTEKLTLGGFWSAYWYNGVIVASEIGRGLDVLQLTPSEFLTQNEIDAAKLIRYTEFNAQVQTKIVWPAKFPVAKAYADQLARHPGVAKPWIAKVSADLAAAEGLSGSAQQSALTALAAQLDRYSPKAAEAAKVKLLAATVKGMAKG